MKKLWQKQWKLNDTIEAFETQGDLVLDQKLVDADVYGSLAHAAGLFKIGILSPKEFEMIKIGLKEILVLAQKGRLILKMGDEDVHTKIENYLTKHYGEVGKKIHAGRSRNDQVFVAIRLFTKEHLLNIWGNLLALTDAFVVFGKTHETTILPGYTHMQKAMPMSLGMWAGAFAQNLLDDLTLLKAAYTLNNQSPLGSAAGFGVPLPLPREYTAKLLGFDSVQENPLACQNSRGKIEAAVVAALVATYQDVTKFASDVLLFTTSEFNYFTVAPELCTGSSIMPQKKNVDIAELLRSKVHLFLGYYVQLVSVSSNLISGYNRDLQDSKKPLFESLDIAKNGLEVATLLVKNIKPNKEVIAKAITPEIFATHHALELVKKGMSFREAYDTVGKNLSSLSQSTRIGLGNTGFSTLEVKMKKETALYEQENNKFHKTLQVLMT
ncbi:argininosuccinate lyase [Candidatus Gottesmanbacteria bacterium]|nr:argininosuccinate lyase [Candidatus Gottesmanbacteria bacterium]